MRVWDTTMLNDEIDILECRLTELDASDIWRFVIVESTEDHHGRPKPLYYAENKDRFSAWSDRIIHVVDREITGPPWDRLHAHRELARAGLTDASPEDILIHSDVDEIITPEGVERAKSAGAGIKFSQRCAVFAVDWELPKLWESPVAGRLGQVGSITAFHYASLPVVRDGGGWHLTWLGGPDAIRRKMGTYCHVEMDEYITKGLETDQFYERGIFWGHGEGDVQLLARDVDESWPRWVQERKCPASWFRPRG